MVVGSGDWSGGYRYIVSSTCDAWWLTIMLNNGVIVATIDK